VDSATGEGLREATRDMLARLTLRESNVLDFTNQSIRQIAAKALRKLRQPNRSEQLQSFLELE
jgi:RNA polymerase primary sigma factor